ncbi:MAG TPA: serine/threonine-protein kinase [Polyangiaceae bacterium]
MESAPVREGEVIAGKFRIGRKLGAGGMGVVVAATHLELDVPVALKFLLRHDELFVERILREARAAARLSGEHVTRVLDVGRLPSGAPYVVMEYLEGETIGEHTVRAGRPPIAEAVDWMVQACAGLAEAHAAGIVHRDIKPANLFLVRRADGTAHVKILDFGVAKVVETEDAGLTTPGSVVGSPSYASPEQLVRPGAVDHRADIWALGVTLYTLLAGELPFSGETIAAKYMRILAETPVRVDTLAPDVPAALADAVERCLAKEPDDRFPDVASLAAALAPFGAAATRVAASRLGGAVAPARVKGRGRAVSPDDPTVVDTTVAVDEGVLAPRARLPRLGLALAGATVVAAVGGAAVWYARVPASSAPAASVAAPSTPPGAPQSPAMEPPVQAAATAGTISTAATASASSPPPGRAVTPTRGSSPRGRDPRSYR